MNERIQKLAEQARQYAIEKIENSQDPAEWSTAMFEQKFAELIVRECASVVKKEMDYDANWCDDKILKHFGVE